MNQAAAGTLVVRCLGEADLDLMDDLLTLFGDAFNEQETYSGVRPRPGYLRRLLGNEQFIALVALEGGRVVGGLAAYELVKFERERSEIYIYDLAVTASHRRRGIATALINQVTDMAAKRGAWVVFVQADKGDEPAIALYDGLGEREEVLHFDIRVLP
jgi:aminoglycoside 3-N-acetyltransferase I